MHTINYTQTFRNDEILENVFIPTSNNWQSTEEEQLSVIESGPKEVLFHQIIEHIKQAQELICLQSFLIQDTAIIDALVEASKRDVKVFVLDASETRLKTQAYPEDDSFIADEYKEMINKKFRRNFVHRQAENLHAKFILIDPNEENATGFLFTGNFNKKPFKENPELGVLLNQEQTNELFKLFVYHFWEHTTDEQNDTETFDKVKPADKFQAPQLNHILCTSPNEDLSNLRNTLLQAIANAKNSISFSTFGLDINHEISQEILRKIKSNTEVTIFCRPREKTIVNHISKLKKAGAKVFCHPLIHAKSLVIDNEEAYAFTANFEEHGMDTGFEIGVPLSTAQTQDLIDIQNNWTRNFPFIYHSERSIQETKKFYSFENKELKSRSILESKRITETKDIVKLIDMSTFFTAKETNNFEKHKNLEVHKEAILKVFILDETTKLEPIDEVLSKVLSKKVIHPKKKKNNTKEPIINWIDSKKVVIDTQWAKNNIEYILKNVEGKWKEYKYMEIYGK